MLLSMVASLSAECCNRIDITGLKHQYMPSETEDMTSSNDTKLNSKVTMQAVASGHGVVGGRVRAEGALMFLQLYSLMR